jgi:hypothetical protein
MKALPLATGLVLFATALPVAQPVQAGTVILRCESADGEVIYTDRACESFGARNVPMSGELITRIASDRDADAFPDAALSHAGSVAAMGAGRRSPAAGCARSQSQLVLDVQGSLALRDVNRLAESYHWVGHTHAQAQPVLVRLDRMNRQRLHNVEFFDVQIAPAAFIDAGTSSAYRADGMAGLMQLSFGHGGGYEVVDFEVRRYAGCYFVRFRDTGYRA